MYVDVWNFCWSVVTHNVEFSLPMARTKETDEAQGVPSPRPRRAENQRPYKRCPVGQARFRRDPARLQHVAEQGARARASTLLRQALKPDGKKKKKRVEPKAGASSSSSAGKEGRGRPRQKPGPAAKKRVEPEAGDSSHNAVPGPAAILAEIAQGSYNYNCSAGRPPTLDFGNILVWHAFLAILWKYKRNRDN